LFSRPVSRVSVGKKRFRSAHVLEKRRGFLMRLLSSQFLSRRQNIPPVLPSLDLHLDEGEGVVNRLARALFHPNSSPRSAARFPAKQKWLDSAVAYPHACCRGADAGFPNAYPARGWRKMAQLLSGLINTDQPLSPEHRNATDEHIVGCPARGRGLLLTGSGEAVPPSLVPKRQEGRRPLHSHGRASMHPGAAETPAPAVE
jgi:hypothetical protein